MERGWNRIEENPVLKFSIFKSSPAAGSSSTVNQPLLFQRLRWQILRNNSATVLQRSPVRLITIVFCSLLIWAGVYAGSAYGFHFLKDKEIPFAGGIVGTLFDLLFFTLGVMLLFSTSIILYSSLFSSAETTFLLSTPVAADQVFAFKYQEAIGFSSTAFILLGSPILIAYGWMFAVPWYFYALLPLYFMGFVLLPGSLGALLCLLLVNYLPRKRKQVLAAAGGMVLLLLGYWLYRVGILAQNAMVHPDFSSDALQPLLGQLGFARGMLVPTHWMTRGLEEAARGNLGEALYPLALIWSNGLFLYLIAAWASRRIYRRGFNRFTTGSSLEVETGLRHAILSFLIRCWRQSGPDGAEPASAITGQPRRRPRGGGWMDRLVAALVVYSHPQTRLLIVKDFRTFRRDPAQWAQVLLFAGLLALYAVITRRFYQSEAGEVYQNGISLVNLTATAFLLCAYTGRFIYPMLSLEGRKFWILGLLPLPRERLLWGKFAFSTTAALLIAESLVLFSDLLLSMHWEVIALHASTVLVLAMGLSGLSVGLGALIPNFRESDPSKVAVGFGGTLNLVIGLLFLLLVIASMSAPYHILVAAHRGESEWGPAAIGWLIVGILGGITLGVLATVLPLRMGARALRRMEF
jgi:ABC-2 type transport system permease protein